MKIKALEISVNLMQLKTQIALSNSKTFMNCMIKNLMQFYSAFLLC